MHDHIAVGESHSHIDRCGAAHSQVTRSLIVIPSVTRANQRLSVSPKPRREIGCAVQIDFHFCPDGKPVRLGIRFRGVAVGVCQRDNLDVISAAGTVLDEIVFVQDVLTGAAKIQVEVAVIIVVCECGNFIPARRIIRHARTCCGI
ncbi:MAG: hypothetical protein A3G34_17290 [Candidatus Lindowbacteria bacterium RIFCSPLOWO2_12_FULL_62_27]|nr:MAG: hypothetical protein A3G34_17290 [Candidatus Lindowbacteria bacterium RIFCSPLOWO2_12_FULL_62_27]OGH62194.1 MAG: hypothetical protein A3I06_01450 [Candidatus Lindowbacteria bacterium RIFCSPLOWO2_02_FULL_62_12]